MANNYNDLNMDIRATDNASKTLDLVIAKISNLKGMLKSMPNFNVGKTASTSQLNKQFQQFQKTGQLTKKITQFQKQQGNLNVYKQAKKNITATTELGNAQYKAARTKKILNTESRKQIDNQIKTNLGLKKNSAVLKKTTKSTKSHLSALSKYFAAAVVIRKLGRIFSATINKSGDWIEALNLFEVTMGSATKGALEFADTLVKSYGVGYNQIVKYIGLFTQMTSAIGVQKDIAADLGQTLTAVGIDIASFYNRTTEATMEMIRAAIAGQTKPARQYGFDVTADSLNQLLEEMGAGTSSQTLNQQQKALLRMMLILKQSKNAWGDMAKTIGSFQNQVKVLTGSLDNLKLAFGDLFIDQATEIMTFVNGFTIAVTDMIRMFEPLLTQTEFGNTIKEQTDIASEGVDELNKSLGLLSFDKFEVLSADKGDDGALSNLINEEYLKIQAEYMVEFNKRIENIKNASNDVAKNIKSWFVIYDEEGGFKAWTTQAKILKGVLIGIGIILGLLTVASLVRGVISLIRLIASLGTTILAIGGFIGKIGAALVVAKDAIIVIFTYVAKVLGVTAGVLGASLAILAAAAAISILLVHLYKTNENYRTAMDNFWFPFFDAVVKYISNWREGIEAIGSAMTEWIENFKAGIEFIQQAFNKLEPPEWLKDGINIAIGSLGGVPAFANGGFPEDGLFNANSNELVGQFSNGKTAVANNSQIVEGIKKGVYEAVVSAMSQQSSGNNQQPIQVNFDLDGNEFARATYDYNETEAVRRGR